MSWRGKVAAVLLAVTAAVGAATASGAETVVRFGFLKPMKAYGETNYQPGEADIRKPLKAYLSTALPDIRFEFEDFELPDLGDAVRAHRVDYALMSSGQYIETRDSGAYALATVYTQRFPDPNRFTAALFVTTDAHPEVNTVADMQGLRAAFNSRANFINYFLPLAEVAESGFNPDRFFSEERFTGDEPQEVLRLMLSSESDVGAFRVCEFETLMQQHPEYRGRFRPVAVKTGGNQACLRSTELYPGWTVAMTSAMNPAVTKRLVEALLAMPVDAESGMGWSVATEFARVNDVYRRIKAGPYAYLREWTLRRIWETYWPWVVLTLLLLAGWVAHWLSVERLAQRRARKLSEAYLKQKHIEEKAIETEARLSALSKLGLVSQLSSIFAHEMGQPLSAIRYRTRTVQTLLRQLPEKKTLTEECLRVIDDEAKKAADILNKVRAYAKGQTDRTTPVRLDLLVENTVADLKRSGRLTGKVSMTLFPVRTKGDALELGLAVLNILKNAAEASDTGRITVTMTGDARTVRVIVENSGSELTAETLAEHMQPLSSRKSDGIGLGIIIIHSVAEAHGGRFSLTPKTGGGATAVLTLPVLDNEEGSGS